MSSSALVDSSQSTPPKVSLSVSSTVWEDQLQVCLAAFEEFIKTKPGEDINVTIFKIEAVRDILKPHLSEHIKLKVLDDLMEEAFVVKQAFDASKEEMQDNAYYENYEPFVPGPDYYLGGEDGCEIIYRGEI